MRVFCGHWSGIGDPAMTARPVFVGLALGLTACAKPPKPSGPSGPLVARPAAISITDAKVQAALDASTPEGRAYEKALTPWFGPAITPVSSKCSAAAPEYSDGRYDLVIQLAGSGSVRRALVDPVTPYTTCVQAAAHELVFPKPPKGGYWTVTTMMGRRER